MAKYNLYNGEFVCHVCKAIVTTLRSYPDEKKLTWMCKDKHLSEVDLQTKKDKSYYEREK